MSPFIQTLENRTLLTASSAVLTADAAQINTDANSVKFALLALKTSELSLTKAVTLGVKVVQAKSDGAANQKLLATLKRAYSSGYAHALTAEKSLVASARSHAAAANAHGNALLAHFASTSLQAKVNADIMTLSTVIPAKLTALKDAVENAISAINAAFSDIAVAEPSVAETIQDGQTTITARQDALGDAASALQSIVTQFALDLGNNQSTASPFSLTGVTLFRGDSTGDNQNVNGSAVVHGAWATGLDVQNLPGNYGAELFISTVANPSASDFLTPGALNAALKVGVNTFYFFGDGDDTQGGSDTFGLNLFINRAANTSPTFSGYTIPGTGQSLVADSAPVTAGLGYEVTPGAGRLAGSMGSSTATLSSFQVLGVSGQGSTVDIVNSTNTAPFTPPAQPDGVFDTYGTFTITVS